MGDVCGDPSICLSRLAPQPESVWDDDGMDFEHPDAVCSMCGSKDEAGGDLVLCDLSGCGRLYHASCDAHPPTAQQMEDEDEGKQRWEAGDDTTLPSHRWPTHLYTHPHHTPAPPHPLSTPTEWFCTPCITRDKILDLLNEAYGTEFDANTGWRDVFREDFDPKAEKAARAPAVTADDSGVAG